MKKLLLATKSEQRQAALRLATIPFQVIKQESDESQCDWGLPLVQLLESIAVHKMNHAVIPPEYDHDIAFVVTADTMGQDNDGATYGKPTSREDAIGMIKALREGGRVGTAYCIDRKKRVNGIWEIDKRIIKCVTAAYTFSMPNHWIERYLEHEPDFMHISGAIDITGYGSQFLETVTGSYGALASMPLYEMRESLNEIGFFNYIGEQLDG